jgi:CheY-like chemotaxis protein
MDETEGSDLKDRRILVVEDEYIIAADLAASLEERGVTVIGPANSIVDALTLLERGPVPDAAVLDVNLGREKVYPVADALWQRGVPFVFATGYDNFVVPDRYVSVPRCEKPIDIRALSRLLSRTTED